MSDDPDLPLAKKPAWKRRPFQIAAVGLIGYSAYLYSQGAPAKPEPVDKTTQAFIGETSGYEPVTDKKPPDKPAEERREEKRTDMEPDKPKPEDKKETAPGAPFDVSDFLPPGAARAAASNPRPAMASFATPHIEPAAKSDVVDPAAGQTTILFKPDQFVGAKASPAIDETCMLQPGILLIELDTAVDSTYPGPLFAHLPAPAYSRKRDDNGQPIILMEAGTQVVGRYESIGANGVKRLIASSAYAHTPNGIWVPLVAAMGDPLGRSGLPAAIDNHVFERFGGAVMLTLTDSAMNIAQAAVSKGGNSYLQLNSGGGGVGSLAQDILRAQSNIAPTGLKHQGELAALVLDHPISFNDSYKVGGRCHA